MRKPVKNYNTPDLSKPVDKSSLPEAPVSCFGEEWDISTRECSVCAANEICGVLTQEKVNLQVKELEKSEGYFLDQQDFTVFEEDLLEEIKNSSGTMTSEQLVNRVAELSKSRDVVAVVEWIKRFIKRTEGLSIKEKIVYYGL